MKGLWRSCLLQLLLWASIAAVFYTFTRSVPVAVGCGLLLSMALIVAGGASRAWKESRILSRAAGNETPRDGEWTAVSGELRCASPLRAPLSGELVAAYEYSIGRDERVGKSMTLVTYYDGKALASSSIATPRGEVRLLTVPLLEVEPAEMPHARTVANAREHVSTAAFEKRETARERTSGLEREWTDDDGVFRIDRRLASKDADLAERFRFEEKHIKPRETVCAFGVYSSERRGLVPDAKWGRPGRIVRGSADQISRSLRGRVIRYAIGAVILASLAIGGAIVFVR